MKFCLLVTVAIDIFMKEKNNTLYLPWISPLSFFYAKRCLLGQTKRKGTPLTIFRPARIFNPPPQLIIFYTNFQPPSLLEPPVYSGH